MTQFEPRPFGKYFLTDRIAVGGMAEIYKAKTFGVDGFEKTLAIKKILPNYSADKDFVTMLTDEAKLVVNLSHPNIVQIYDLGRVGEDYFISMEFIDGINLRELINRGQELNETLPPDIGLYIASEICKGLDYAHTKRGPDGAPLGIVHRDVSPHNILVSFEGEVKIVDFGIAKAARNVSQTEMGALKGKVTYMSPEQAVGRLVDARTDVFSCGIVLYEALTFERLFTGDSQMEVLNLIRSTRITAEKLKGKVPEAALKVTAKALAYNVADRYQSASDMQIDLTRALYAKFPEFTPRRLAELLARWYGRAAARKETPLPLPSYEAESMLALSSRDQIELVHREASAPDPMLPETLKAGLLKKDEFARERPPPAGPGDEPTERKIGAAAIPERPKSARGRMFVAAAIAFALLAAYVAVDFAFHAFEEKGSGVGSARVKLSSSPQGAAIFLDGEGTGLVTPALLKGLKVGQEYELTLVKDGYKTLVTNVLLESPRPLPLKLDLKAESARIFALSVRSEPAGARVIFDGKDTGLLTPTEFRDLEIGRTYKIELMREGYQAYASVVVNKNPRDQIMDVSLVKRRAATFTLTSDPPGAEILLDGRPTGFSTPYTMEDVDYPRVVEFTFRKDGFGDAVETVGVTRGGRQKVHVTLPASPAGANLIH